MYFEKSVTNGEKFLFANIMDEYLSEYPDQKSDPAKNTINDTSIEDGDAIDK